MLSQEDRLRLAEIEQRLLADDPRFVARMRAAGTAGVRTARRWC